MEVIMNDDRAAGVSTSVEPPKYTEDFGRFSLQFPWILAAFTVVLSALLFYRGHWLIAFVPLLTVLMYRFKEVQATTPPTIGILSIWNKVADGTLHPKKYLTLPFFPFMMDIALVNRKFQELTFKFLKIPCLIEQGKKDEQGRTLPPSAGGTVDPEVSLALEPDEEHPVRYLLAGGNVPSETKDREGTKTELHDILFNNIVQAFQDFAMFKTWETVVFTPRFVIGVYLVEALTGIPFKDPDDSNKVLKIDPTAEKYSPKLVRKCERALRDALRGEQVIRIPSWGIKLRQFKVGPILPPEELRAAAVRIAEEKKKREEENTENVTLNLMTQTILEDSRERDEDNKPTGKPTLSYQEARRMALVQKEVVPERIERVIIESGDGRKVTPIEVAGTMAGRSS